jgi:hypothetical protein
MFNKLRRKALILVAAICAGGSPFVTVAGCDSSTGSFKFFRDDDSDDCCYDYYDYGYVDVGYDDGYYYEDEYYYEDDCYYYGDCY